MISRIKGCFGKPVVKSDPIYMQEIKNLEKMLESHKSHRRNLEKKISLLKEDIRVLKGTKVNCSSINGIVQSRVESYVGMYSTQIFMDSIKSYIEGNSKFINDKYIKDFVENYKNAIEEIINIKVKYMEDLFERHLNIKCHI